MQLAGDANQIVPMTDDEKCRVNSLLEQDDDDLEMLESNFSEVKC